MKVGIIGGGQLGMMITEAAKKLSDHISEVIVLDPNISCPATKSGARQIVADFKDETAIKQLADMVDILTYEIESGDSTVLQSLVNKTQINPSPNTLKTIQDKLLQKSFLQENNIPVGDFLKVDNIHDLHQGIKKFGLPVLLKARRDAYDGRGNYIIKDIHQVQKAYEYFNNRPVYLEKFIDFKIEVSVISARNTRGDIKTYSLVENIHKDNILKITIAPARVPQGIIDLAQGIARKTMEVLNGAGVFGIEMFVTQDDKILINEIAPRVHNSGHHTLESCKTSQFEQHLRAILGLDLGDTTLYHNAIMYNILGPKHFTGRYKPISIKDKDVFLKMYNKTESKPQRKMGHFNLIGTKDTPINELLKRAEMIGKSIKIEPI